MVAVKNSSHRQDQRPQGALTRAKLKKWSGQITHKPAASEPAREPVKAVLHRLFKAKDEAD